MKKPFPALVVALLGMLLCRFVQRKYRIRSECRIILYREGPKYRCNPDKGVHTYILNFIVEIFLIFVVVRLAWGAYRYLVRPRSAAAKADNTGKNTAKQRGRFDTKGQSVQDAEFIDLKDDKP